MKMGVSDVWFFLYFSVMDTNLKTIYGFNLIYLYFFSSRGKMLTCLITHSGLVLHLSN